jgi:hypothetical protein
MNKTAQTGCGIAAVVCMALAAEPNGVAGDGGGRVSGRVMKSQRSLCNGRSVHLKGHDPVTVKDGRFTLDRVPATYDLWVGLEGEAPVTAYRGLTRRNPVLEHGPSFVTSLDEPSRKATISGILRGDFPFPIEKGYLLNFSFLSTKTTSHWQMWDGTEVMGPRFGHARASWNGAPKLSGLLVVLGYHTDKEKKTEETFLASAPIELTDKADTAAELTLARISRGHIAGEIKVPYIQSWNGMLSFQLSGGRGEIGIPCSLKVGHYDCEVPDLTALGGEYCIHFIDGTSHGAEVQRCGGRIGMIDFSLTVQAPPKLRLLDEHAKSNATMALTWSGDERAVYSVDIRPDIGAGIKWFEFRLYTSGTRLAWKELKAYGIETPAGSKRKYEVSVSRMYPYRTVDELASEAGPFSRTVEYQRVTSNSLEIELKE